MWSMPWMRPLATDGAAPRTTTNAMASSLILKSRIASGNQAMDGMVWRPVMSEPMAARSTANLETSAPTTTPMATASPKPQAPRTMVMPMACQSPGVPMSCARRSRTVMGPGRT